VFAQWPVRFSLPRLRTAPPISQGFGSRLGTMKDRFPTDRRPAWRQRFLAIAHELEAGPPRRDSIEAHQAARRPLLAGRSLRGIRLGCIRIA
jgi:hypothetical protein